MELVNTYKSWGKGPQKMYLVLHVVSYFPSKAVMTIDCDSIGDQSIKKDWNVTWVTAYHVPYGKKSIKLL